MGSINIRDIDYFPSNLEFAVFTSDEIKKLSVVKVITGLTFDPLGHPLPGGLYDNVMGTYGRCMEPCLTCLNIYACPGHMGHIELNALVYNPFFIKIVQKLLTISCLKCFKIQIKEHVLDILQLQLQLLEAGYIIEAQELEIYKSELVCANVDMPVKLEQGDTTHPRITQLKQLLQRGKNENVFTTKTSCALRNAIINASFQRPQKHKCIHCSTPLRSIRYMNRKLVYFVTKNELKHNNPQAEHVSGKNKVILADECLGFLKEIYQQHSSLLKLVYPILNITPTVQSDDFCPMQYFFIDVVPVTPPKARPSNVLRDQIVEHQQTSIYRSIIENNNVLRVVLRHLKGQDEELSEEAKNVFNGLPGKDAYEKLYNAWQALQTSVDLLLDGAIKRESPSMGLKQVLEKKEGLIRKHMMGKRVNFAARTVITPDPNINVEEVGIPVIFASKLSYPVPVTPWNVTELRKMVMNGPLVHPGANYIQDEKGYTTLIPHDSAAKRESMAKLLLTLPENGTKIVHRHVVNGDILLLNRQPSLHKPSIMAHKARILPGEKTFRMHYSNCKAYNADFDGDEMNAHLPQNEVARSEAYNLVNVANNYLVPKDGTPLGGLIQDHVISGVKLSMRGRFFNKEDYQQLVFQGLAHIKGDITLLPPTIIKPQMLWSGKQILSTIIINIIPKGLHRINLDSNAKMNPKSWISCAAREPVCARLRNDIEMTESEVIIRNGELLVGVLDKQQYGATTFGLVHCMYELYGGNVSTNLLTALTKVFTYFLQREGFTLGVKDILVSAEGDKKRQRLIRECREIGNSAVAAALELNDVPALDILAEKMDEAYVKDPKFRVLLDRKYKKLLDGYTNDINRTCLPAGLITKIPHNNLQLMVLSGAKGSLVNTMQISCLLGQIELEGKRPPLMISGKSLPSFTSFETSPKSGGFIDGRFMTGIQPQDFFFHCMAGREGLIDTAVKTSRSGYLQRCLIKHLEGLAVHYDMTVRDSDNSVVQFLYGEDGLDIVKSKFLNKPQGCKFLYKNAKVILQAEELESIKDDACLAMLSKHTKKINSWLKKHMPKSGSKRTEKSAFTQFSVELRDDISIENPDEINPKTGRRRLDESILQLWQQADDASKARYRKKHMPCPDPAAAIYKQDSYYGAVSERMHGIIEAAKVSDAEHKDVIADIMYLKNIKSLVAPGEPVGLLAAQSIGEPSTQMTLNTFHFAGRGEMNVTLGIPRLREILMLASANIKTPSMDIPIKESQLKNAEKLRIHLNRVTVADILHFVNVKVKTVMQPERAHQYQVRFQFLPRSAYQQDFCVKPKKIIKYMTDTFFKNLFRVILKSAQKKSIVVEIEDEKSAKSKAAAAADDGNYDDEADNELPKQNLKKDNVEASSSEDENEGNNEDFDATDIKLKARNRDETEYDDPEENEEQADADAEELDEDDEQAAQVDKSLEEKATQADEEENDKLATKVLSNTMVKDFLYDKQDQLWCQLTFNLEMRYKKPNIASIIRELAQKSVLHQVPNIKRSIIYKGDNEKLLLKTDGINIVEMFGHNKILELNQLYSNDIHAIARTYGIEAAARVIVKEVSNVFKVYGIEVDMRHLSLIADYMTFDGTFQPLSRKGMEHSSSPLLQMSFESCLQFLKAAAGAGKNDEFHSPSSRIMVGLPVRNGTGAFELLNSFA